VPSSPTSDDDSTAPTTNADAESELSEVPVDDPDEIADDEVVIVWKTPMEWPGETPAHVFPTGEVMTVCDSIAAAEQYIAYMESRSCLDGYVYQYSTRSLTTTTGLQSRDADLDRAPEAALANALGGLPSRLAHLELFQRVIDADSNSITESDLTHPATE